LNSAGTPVPFPEIFRVVRKDGVFGKPAIIIHLLFMIKAGAMLFDVRLMLQAAQSSPSFNYPHAKYDEPGKEKQPERETASAVFRFLSTKVI
jgi:hypothetical protein